MEHEPLVQGNYYHIFNRGNNRCNLFEHPAEYEHFLWLYDKYISPVADTLAWVLMRNHFHFLVYIKTDVVYKYSIETLNRISPDKIWYEDHKWETVDADLSASLRPDNVKVGKKPIPYRHFSHLFNAYSRYLQTRNGRTGNLFERPFKRKMIDTDEYLKTVVLYIHNNPVHHGFCNHTMEYPWTSYLTSISEKPTKLKRDEVIKLFNDKENFKQQHNHEIDIAPIEKWLEIAPSDLHDFDLNLSQHESDADRACSDLSGSKDAVRSEERTTVDFDLSACVAPDNVKMENDNVELEMVDEMEIVNTDSSMVDADRACSDLSGSKDAVRSEERTTVDFDLSACVAFRFVGTSSDNVKMMEMIDEMEMIDADRSRDAVRSGEAAPDNVAEIPADGKRETN